MRSTRTALATVTAAAAMLTATACGGGSNSPLGGGNTASGNSNEVAVGAAGFPEGQVLGELYAAALEAKGVKVKRVFNLKSRELYLKAMTQGSFDVIPEYTEQIDRFYNKNATATTKDAVYAELKTSLPANLTVLDASAADDHDTVTVSKAFAAKNHLTRIEDLKPFAKDMVFGGPSEFQTRTSTGIPAIQRVYGLTFKAPFKSFQDNKSTAAALVNGQIQAGNIFSTDPWFNVFPVVELQDPKKLFGVQNVVPLIVKSKASGTVADTLNAVSAKLTTPELIAMNKEYVVDKKDASEVAKGFLTKNGLG